MESKKSLVIAEKPSVAKDIARVLNCNKKTEGALEGSKYVVTWAYGHLVTLASPEVYNKNYKEWKMEHLPMLPEKVELEIIPQTAKQYKFIKNQIFRNDIGSIIIATDAGREGELVARLILEKAKNTKPIKRLWISSVTDKAIAEGFAHLKNGKEYDNLYLAALSRAEADWLVGMNATRALTCKFNASLSCGRVQTPTLAMIATREEEIRHFKPKNYYGMTASANRVTLTWQDEISKKINSFDKDRIEKIYNELKGKKAVITEVKKSAKKTYAPLLYDLTELQRDANKRFNFSAKETLNIMQRLYENYKILTYPRTDSRYISTDIIDTLSERLRACSIGPYKKLGARLLMGKIQGRPNFADNKKVTDHHAIIPTEQFVPLDSLSSDERKIYDLVVKRFLAVLYPPFEYEQITLEAEIGNHKFLAQGKVIRSSGWKEVYDNQQNEDEESMNDLKEQTLPEIKKGEVLDPISLKITEGKTKPPAPFNEATLLSAMENPSKFMESQDQKMIKTLGDTGGLGTVATRADIIDKLLNSFLMEKKGKDLFITGKGRQLLELVPSDLRKPELTAQLEGKLLNIAAGKLQRPAFIKEIRQYSADLVKEIKTSDGAFRHDNLTNTKCPHCGKRMLSVNGKNSKMLVCQDRECGHRETIARISNARCPVCHKKLELRGKGDSQLFVCVCGHKEKLSAFQERRKKEGAGVTKKDVANYMKNKQKEEQEPINNAFADALSKLKL